MFLFTVLFYNEENFASLCSRKMAIFELRTDERSAARVCHWHIYVISLEVSSNRQCERSISCLFPGNPGKWLNILPSAGRRRWLAARESAARAPPFVLYYAIIDNKGRGKKPRRVINSNQSRFARISRREEHSISRPRANYGEIARGSAYKARPRSVRLRMITL